MTLEKTEKAKLWMAFKQFMNFMLNSEPRKNTVEAFGENQYNVL